LIHDPKREVILDEEVQEKCLEFLISCLEVLKVLPRFKEVFYTLFYYFLDSFILL